MLGYFFAVLGVSGVSFKFLFGYIFYPLAWIMGVPVEDCMTVGQLISTKTLINEFAAYTDLAALLKQQATPENGATILVSRRAEVIATYALCGFSNIASIGIQIGGLSGMCPEKQAVFARLGVKSMIAGAVSTRKTKKKEKKKKKNAEKKRIFFFSHERKQLNFECEIFSSMLLHSLLP